MGQRGPLILTSGANTPLPVCWVHPCVESNTACSKSTATNVPEGEDVWKYIALGNKESATVKDDGWKYRGLSYFTRLNYNYNDKYMLMFTFRADGSSKYNDKWGYFPSIGAAWVISQEPFMKNQNIFDYT